MRILLLAGILSSAAAAQSLTEVPPIVQLVRKAGTGGASIKPYANARAAVNVIGMASVTGLPETWLLESHYSFASVEDLDQRLSALAPVRALNDPSGPVARRRADALAHHARAIPFQLELPSRPGDPHVSTRTLFPDLPLPYTARHRGRVRRTDPSAPRHRGCRESRPPRPGIPGDLRGSRGHIRLSVADSLAAQFR